jgi:hypothetical protein
MMSIMRTRSLTVLVIGALGLALVGLREPRPRVEHATADPSIARPTTPALVAPDADPVSSTQGLAVLHDTAKPAGKSRKQVPPTPAADLTDPWSGEDLSSEVHAAVVARTLPIDRVDPWNPQTSYPSLPSPDINLDPIDPWVHADGPPPVRIAKKTTPKTLATDDPWATL